jgi:23S rRNA (adenine2503-C2)-methyltransferase
VKSPTLAQLRRQLTGLGAKPAHLERILRLWLRAKPLDTPFRKAAAATFFPASLLGALPAFAARLADLARVHAEFPAEDGACRLLLRLLDGQRVESVLLPGEGVCVSTQAGCAVGCAFCATGRHGLARQLLDSEILAQVALARARRSVKRVVFMGMGEPAHNLDNVFSAIRLLGLQGGFGHKRMVVSSVGGPRLFERLAAEIVHPALALSLHSADPDRRAALLPNAPPMTPEALVAAGEAYAHLCGHPIQYQWTVLAGINDGDDEVAGIIRLLRGKHAMMNLIAYNPPAARDSDCAPCGEDRIVEMTRRLNRAGILTRIRRSAGRMADGGCGQLWARTT